MIGRLGDHTQSQYSHHIEDIGWCIIGDADKMPALKLRILGHCRAVSFGGDSKIQLSRDRIVVSLAMVKTARKMVTEYVKMLIIKLNTGTRSRCTSSAYCWREGSLFGVRTYVGINMWIVTQK